MQPLDLNLASRPFRNNVLLWVGYVTATVLLVGATWANVATWADNRSRLAALRDEATSFDSQRRELETRATRASQAIRRFDLDALRAQVNKANEVIEWKAFSWTRLFNEMERIQPNNVKMNVVRPIFHGRNNSEEAAEQLEGHARPVAIEGRAKTFRDFTDLEHRLQEDPRFGRVEPDRVNRTENGEILFQLRFVYLPDSEGGETEAGTAPEGEAEPAPAEPEVEPEAAPASAPVESVAEAADDATVTGPPPAPVEVQEAWAGEAAEDKAAEAETPPRPVRGKGQVGRRPARAPARGSRMEGLKPRPKTEGSGDDGGQP